MAVSSDTNFEHALIIHTSTYTGNFERQLCAYATGSIGECNVGKEHVEGFEAAFAARFPEEDDQYAVQDITANVPDDNGCWRPCSIWNWKGDFYKSMAIFMEDKPEDQYMAFIKERALEFATNNNFTITGFTWVKRTVTIQDEETDLT